SQDGCSSRTALMFKWLHLSPGKYIVMKQLWIVLLITALAVPAMGQSCKGGKCISPRQRAAMKKQAMKARQSSPMRANGDVQKINYQILNLAKTNYGGRNNGQIKSLQSQRNQMLKASLKGR